MEPYFPMFVNLKGQKILVAGGGRIAFRRVSTLLRFGAELFVVAPEICEELDKTAKEHCEQIHVELRPWREKDLDEMQLVLAATDDREVNRQIVSACKKRGIPVNTADDKTLCDFYFPSVVMNEEIVIGLNSGGEDPARTKAVRERIEAFLSS